jgi:hypothetical protein
MNLETSENRAASASGVDSATRIAAGLRLPIISYLLLAIVAGGIFLGIYNTAFPIYEVPANLRRNFPSDEDAQKREVAFRFATTLHVTIGLAILGGLLAALLGTGEAWASQPNRGAYVRAGIGVVLATLAGAAGGLAGALLAIPLEPLDATYPMARIILVHVVMLGVMSAGVGLAVGWVSGSGRATGLSSGTGFASGVLAALVFPIFGAFVMPHLKTDAVVPDGSRGIFGCVSSEGVWGMILWILFATVILGLMLPLMNRGPKKAA